METEDSVGCIVVIVGLVIFLGMGLIGIWVNSERCEQKFESFAPHYSLIQGCMIEYKGVKIPSENFRFGDMIQ